jgi:ABC-type transport system involved in multi-copper enzyme maturation permease subunit
VNALLRAELLKQRTTRTSLGFFLVMLTLILFAVVLHSFGLKASSLASHDNQMHVFGWGGLGALFAALVGAMSMTSEIRHGTIRPTFLATPRRGRVVVTKALAGSFLGVVLGLVAETFAIGVGSAALNARGIPVRLDASNITQLLAGGVAAAALWGPIGVGLGALLRNQVSALVGLFAWLLFVEGLLFGLLPGAARFLPGTAGAAIAGTTTTGEVAPLLSPAVGALLLVLYVTAAGAAALIATNRRDVA